MTTEFEECNDGREREGVEDIKVLLLNFVCNFGEDMSEFGVIDDGIVDFDEAEYDGEIDLVISNYPASILFPHFE